MPELGTVPNTMETKVSLTIHANYYVVEKYGPNITPEVICTFLSFSDAREFVIMQGKRFPWLTHDICRYSTHEVMPIGATED